VFARTISDLANTVAFGWLPLLADRPGEDIRRRRFRGADHVGVDAQCDRGVGMAEAGRDNVDGHARHEERGRVDMAKVVQPGLWQLGVRVGIVVAFDQDREERADM